VQLCPKQADDIIRWRMCLGKYVRDIFFYGSGGRLQGRAKYICLIFRKILRSPNGNLLGSLLSVTEDFDHIFLYRADKSPTLE
jgi:hypothetical protein